MKTSRRAQVGGCVSYASRAAADFTVFLSPVSVTPCTDRFLALTHAYCALGRRPGGLR